MKYLKSVLIVLITCTCLFGCAENQVDIQNDGNKEAPEAVQKVVSPSEKTEIPVKKEPEKKEEPVKAVTNTISDKKLAWSLVRSKDHLTPVFPKKASEIADKYGAIYLANTSEKKIYLTFDEGYENGYTGKILDVLKDNNVKAAFFITKPYLDKEFALVKRMIDEGHIVGNHTVHHKSMPTLSDEMIEKELVGLDSEFREQTGLSMDYMRPPMGEFSERTLSVSKKLGYTNVFWSFAYADWKVNEQKGTDYAFKMVTDNIHNGSVLLLHAVSKDNAEALDSIIKYLKQEGYVFGALNEISN